MCEKEVGTGTEQPNWEVGRKWPINSRGLEEKGGNEGRCTRRAARPMDGTGAQTGEGGREGGLLSDGPTDDPISHYLAGWLFPEV